VCGFGAKEARALDIHRLDACRREGSHLNY
jgi:hypothetical protein